MKKLLVLLVIILAITSCRTTSECPQFGEQHKYQKSFSGKYKR